MAMVVRDQEAALRMLLDDLVRINEAPLDLAKHNVADGIAVLSLEGEQGAAFQDRQHRLAIAFHLALAAGLQFLLQMVVFIHVFY